MIVYEGTPDKLEIEFDEARWDWIEFTLTIAERKTKVCFSSCMGDPIIDFRLWLEAITLGVEYCGFAFTVDTPWPERRFDWHYNKWRDDGLFSVTEPADPSRPAYLEGWVKPDQLITALYRGFLAFRESEKFVEIKFEQTKLWETLSTAYDMTYESLAAYLAKLDWRDLNDAIACGFPEQEETITLYEPEGWSERTFEPIIPYNWDRLDYVSKLNRVFDLLDRELTNNQASKLSDLRSPIIEDYLARKAFDLDDTIIDICTLEKRAFLIA